MASACSSWLSPSPSTVIGPPTVRKQLCDCLRCRYLGRDRLDVVPVRQDLALDIVVACVGEVQEGSLPPSDFLGQATVGGANPFEFILLGRQTGCLQQICCLCAAHAANLGI